MNTKQNGAFTLIYLLIVISIISILFPYTTLFRSQVQIKGAQTKDLSNAKQIGLACRLCSTDNDGKYPVTDPSGAALIPAGGANMAFKNLVPQYIPQEKIFYLSKSAWTPSPPDEIT